MHAFMAVVFTGPGRSNALRANAQANPPLRQLADTTGDHRGKGRAIVRAQCLGQAVRSKHPLEPGLDDSCGHAVQSPALQDEAAVIVSEGQGVAALAAPESEVALEVGAPTLCRSAAGDQGARVRRDAAALAPWPHQAVSLEDVGSRAVGWPRLSGLQCAESIHDLLGSKA